MLNKISDRVYYMDYVQNGDRPVLGLICGDKYSLIVDGGNSKEHAQKFLNYISELDIKPVKYLALTHWHWDHVFGMTTIDAINIVHKNSNEKLKWMKTLEWTDEAIANRVKSGEEIEFCEEHIKIEHPDNDRKLEIADADIIFDKNIEIDLGGVIVKLQHIETDHSNDCVLVNVVNEGIVFMGDAMYLDMYNGEYSYSREKLYPLLDELNSYNASYYIPAHHPKYTKKEFEDFTQHIKEIGDCVKDSINKDEIIKIYEAKKRRQLTQEEIDDINTFIEGNKKSK
ncbi:MAG: MBL fold metallo-hydrolase [Peptostreptococcaceae bacterium]